MSGRNADDSTTDAVIALLAGILLVIAGPGVRRGLWSFQSGFVLLRWAAYLGLGTAAVAMVQLLVPI